MLFFIEARSLRYFIALASGNRILISTKRNTQQRKEGIPSSVTIVLGAADDLCAPSEGSESAFDAEQFSIGKYMGGAVR